MVAMIQTPFEAGQIWAERYQGKKARLCLAVNPGTLGASGTTAQWDSAEIGGNGYARYEWALPAGAYSNGNERFEAPSQLCQFQASAGGVGLSWDTAYLVLGTISGGTTTWNTGVSFLLVESPTIALYPGEPRGYSVTLFTDGFLIAS